MAEAGHTTTGRRGITITDATGVTIPATATADTSRDIGMRATEMVGVAMIHDPLQLPSVLLRAAPAREPLSAVFPVAEKAPPLARS